MNLRRKEQLLQRRRCRIRKKLNGTLERPRLSVYLSHKHFYAQCIDDAEGRTLAYTSTLAGDIKAKKLTRNVKGAAEFGKIAAVVFKKAGIKSVIFDRGIRHYQGALKAFAEAVREEGLNF